MPAPRRASNPTIQIALVGLITSLLLFLPAGTLQWWNAWAYMASFLVFATLSTRLYKDSPELLEERRTASKKAKAWDKPIVMAVVVVLPLAMLLLAGFDRRFGWTTPVSPWVSGSALVVMVAANGLVHWAMRTNAFFSSFARIQDDRGHKVVSGGPYRYVRHPAYTGLILGNVTGPLLLGSMVALYVGLVSSGILVLRTALEDRMLRKELEGYEAYASQTRHRLIPYLW